MRSAALLVAVALVLAISPPLLPPYGQHILILVELYGAVALAWNILGGMTGQMSLGHALFVGTGAYVSTALYLDLGVSPWLGLIAATAAGGALGAIFGYAVFRRRLSGVYFALVTLAFAEIALHTASNISFLGAGNGLAIPSRPDFANLQFSSKTAFCYAGLAVLVVAGGVLIAIRNSRLGYALAAIRNNERAAAALGIDVVKSKVIAASLSGALAAMVGPVYASYALFIDPESVFGISISVDALLFSLVGGVHALFGPLLGAAILVPLTEFLRNWLGGAFASLHLIVYGVILIAIMRIAPNGLAGLLGQWTARRAP
jgi:branched-chain amino acid transport system permease protein